MFLLASVNRRIKMQNLRFWKKATTWAAENYFLLEKQLLAYDWTLADTKCQIMAKQVIM